MFTGIYILAGCSDSQVTYSPPISQIAHVSSTGLSTPDGLLSSVVPGPSISSAVIQSSPVSVSSYREMVSSSSSISVYQSSSAGVPPFISTEDSGTVIDSRDSLEYQWVRIGTQVWMAENLNFSGGGLGSCYDLNEELCNQYGRLYSWTQALNDSVGSSATPSGIRGICPENWHIPSAHEIEILAENIENLRDSSAYATELSWRGVGAVMKTIEGWERNDYGEVGGTDDVSFAALPGGVVAPVDVFTGGGTHGYWWSTTEITGGNAISLMVSHNASNHEMTYIPRIYGASVRCIR